MSSKDEREALAAKFDRHVDEEGKILAGYRALAEKFGDGPVGFLLNTILTEEEMHHLIFRTTAQWLRQPPAEDPPEAVRADRDEILRYTADLKKHERETIGDCRSLTSGLSGKNGELLDSLIRSIVLDSEKPHGLLEAVEKLLKVG